MIRALVTGCGGQVGSEVAKRLANRAEVTALDHKGLDLANPMEIVARLAEIRPALIVNAAAYTAVDRAESEPELARAVNASAPGLLGAEARRLGALLVHYSTDYVFDGAKAGPYGESDPTAPMSVYGRTKLEGERAIAASGCAHLILRTSWVYGPRGRNFLTTMLSLAMRREEIRVVDDQRGAPTSSAALARATLDVLAAGDRERTLEAPDLDRAARASGVYHASAAGEVTWHGFAQAIFERWPRHSSAPFRAPRVVPIPTSEYPSPARRPANSVLSNARIASTFSVRLPGWEEGLEETLAEIASG